MNYVWHNKGNFESIEIVVKNVLKYKDNFETKIGETF